MGHSWKKQRAKPGMTYQEYWGIFYPLFEDGTIDRENKLYRQRKAVTRMKQNCRALEEKNRLLKRKISDFAKQGEENGKSKKLG